MIPDLERRVLIDGRLVALPGDGLPVLNPANGAVVGHAASCGPAEIEAAVRAARAAFRPWADLAPARRAAHLRRLGELIDADADAMAAVMTREQGKPLDEARGEIRKLAQICRFYAEEAVRVHGETIPNETDEFQSTVVREPVGVVGAITPWNYPAELIGWKLCGALAAGCTVVVKPAEITPFTALAIAAKVVEAGIPAGVVGVVTGAGAVAGQALVEHAQVDKIAFTGSSATGLAIQRSCTTVKRLTLELGGNCPMIVTASADLGAAVAGATRRSFRNCGQICIAINRIYVARALYEEFAARLGADADALRVADGMACPDADMGPMASAEALAKAQDHLADALARGARLVAGGSAPEGLGAGHFLRPTVLADCTHAMKVMTQETFGPIVGLAPFDALSEAVAMANDTPYGLASYVYARDADEIRWLSARLDTGSVAVNNVDAGIVNAPYGGRKQSGTGYEHGREGMLEYTNLKHVRVRYAEPEGA